MSRDGVLIAEGQQVGVSMSAWALLQTLLPSWPSDYVRDGPGYLFPCGCNSALYFNQFTGRLGGLVCPASDHEELNQLCLTRAPSGAIMLQHPAGAQIFVGHEEWSAAVAGFSREVRRFYFSGAPRVPWPDDEEWYPRFLDDWQALQTLAEAQPNEGW